MNAIAALSLLALIGYSHAVDCGENDKIITEKDSTFYTYSVFANSGGSTDADAVKGLSDVGGSVSMKHGSCYVIKGGNDRHGLGGFDMPGLGGFDQRKGVGDLIRVCVATVGATKITFVAKKGNGEYDVVDTFTVDEVKNGEHYCYNRFLPVVKDIDRVRICFESESANVAAYDIYMSMCVPPLP